MRRWLGANGGTRCTVFLDGWLEGLWRVVDGEIEVERARLLLAR